MFDPQDSAAVPRTALVTFNVLHAKLALDRLLGQRTEPLLAALLPSCEALIWLAGHLEAFLEHALFCQELMQAIEGQQGEEQLVPAHTMATVVQNDKKTRITAFWHRPHVQNELFLFIWMG